MFLNNEKVSHYPLVALLNHNEDNKDFFLFCTSKAVKKAVVRNKLKRIMREEVRLNWNKTKGKGMDVCIMANPDLMKLSSLERSQLFIELFYKINNRRKKI